MCGGMCVCMCVRVCVCVCVIRRCGPRKKKEDFVELTVFY